MRWRLHERDPQPHCIRGQPRLACAVVGHLSWRTGELLGTAIGWSTGLCDMARTVRDGACREGSSSQRASAARLETRRVTAEVRGARRESSSSQRASAAQLETRGVTAEGSSRPGHRVCGKSSTSCYGDQRIFFPAWHCRARRRANLACRGCFATWRRALHGWCTRRCQTS